MTITLRRADVADSATLAALGRATFIETFVQKFNMPYAPADVEDFFASAYTAERVAQSMATRLSPGGWRSGTERRRRSP